MSFKISDAIYAGTKESPDAQEIFLSKFGDKHKKIKKSKETSISINPAPDQRNLPYNRSPKMRDDEKTQKQNISISNENPQLSTTQNMTNIDSPQKTNSSKSPSIQSDSYSTDHTNIIQEQFMDNDEKDESVVDPKLNPLYQLLKCETQIDKLNKAKATERQNIIDSQNRLFQNKHVIPKFTRPKSPQSDPTTSTSSLLLSEDIYYNKLIDQGKWSVMWSREKVKNVPLIFDSGDKFFPIADINKAIQKPKTIKRWNNLNLLDFEKCKDSYLEQKDPDDIYDQTIQNSEVANSLTLVEPTITDFEHFHHPAYRPKLKEELIVTQFKSSQKVVKNDHFILNSVEDLSAKNGDVYLIEHAVENQPFILNVGMNSLLITYLLTDEKFDISTFSDDFKKTLKIIEKDEESPFVAQLPLNKPVQTIYCPLFRMPISIHKKNETDFLLVKDKLQKKFYIRRFDKIFCAKLLEPQVEVMKPGSIKSQKIQDEFVKAKIINIFRGTDEIHKIEKVTISGLRHSYFPNMSKQKLRNILSKYAEYKTDKGNGYWQLKPEIKKNLDSKFSRLNITPDDVCNYQSMLHGLLNLKKNCVNILKDEPKIHNQISKLKGERTKIIAEKIELELMKTPWLKTRNFVGAFQSNAVEIDNADGETIFKKKKRRRENVDKKEKESIAGSLKDIRKKTKDELGELLTPYFSKEQIEKMERWDRVKFLKKIAERKLEEDPENQTLENFVRKNDSYANYCLKFKKFYQQSFENNLNFISSKDAVETEVASVDDDNYLNELNEMMNNENENDEEEEEFLEIEEKNHEKSLNDQIQKSYDPKEFVPFGVCTYPTKIDWKLFGLDQNKVKMRPVVKKIHVSLNNNKKVKVKVEWIRNQEEIKECKKKPKVYQDLSFVEKKKIKKSNKKKPKNNERADLVIDDNDDNGVLVLNDNQSDRPKLKISSNCMKRITNAHENYLNSKEK